MKMFCYSVRMLPLFAAPASATVTVSTPSNDETTGSSVQFVASATTTCSKGVSSMGIYVDGDREYVVGGAKLETSLSLAEGTHTTVVEEWDGCGGASTASRTVTVSSAAGVTVSTPANGATVSSPASFVASATTSCSKGVSSMGIYVNGTRVLVVDGSKLNSQVSMSSGTHSVVVEEWDG